MIRFFIILFFCLPVSANSDSELSNILSEMNSLTGNFKQKVSDKNGLILKEISLDTEGLISGEVYPSKGISPYMRFGDYPVLMLIFSIMLFYWKRYKKYE